MAAYVTLVNRTTKNLQGVWDGRHYDIAPGKHSYPEIQAMKFKDQNPVMGSEDPYTLTKQYLIGIVEFGDDVTPIEQSSAPVLSAEIVARIAKGELVVVKANNPFNRFQDATAPLGNDSTFVKP